MAREGDEYQREYMAGHGEALYLERTRFRGLMAGLGALGAFLWVGSAATAITGATTGMNALFLATGALACVGALVGAAGVLFSVLRIAVTAKELHVQYGLSGPRIPIENIVSAGVEEYEYMKYGGYGVKIRLRDGHAEHAYTMPTEDKRVVRIVWREGEKTKHAVFSSRDPDAVVSAIERARMMRVQAGPFRARVEAPDEQEEVEIAAGEREERRAR